MTSPCETRAPRANAAREAGEVAVERRVFLLVAQDDDVAVAAVDAREVDDAVGGRFDAGAGRRAVVDACVRAPALEDRVEARRR